jgi:uncharacterized repeat protein (TIGR04052 family)
MKRTLSTLALIGSGILLNGCGGSSSSSDSNIDISIPFKAVAGSESIRCGKTISALGTANGGAGSDVTLADFRMFVNDIKLVTDQGIEIPVMLDANHSFQNADVALLDFRDKANIDTQGNVTNICTSGTSNNPNYNDTVKGSVTIDPAYTISYVQFTLGVPFDLNHADQSAAVEPLRNPGLATGMHWNWQGGYKFTAFDVLPVGGVTRPSTDAWSSPKWNMHLGSTGCSVGTSDLGNGTEPETCSAPNRSVIKLAIGAIDLDDVTVQIDYAELISMNTLAEDNAAAPGCMSGGTDPECETIFEKLGLSWGENNAQAQSVFSIINSSESLDVE